MKTSLWIGFGLALALPACGGARPAGARVTNPARTASGATITTGQGQAVAADAHSRFVEAARNMRTHDAANNNRGDWTPDLCNQIASQFEAAANLQPGGNFPEAWLNRGLAFDRCNLLDQERVALQRAIQAANNNHCRARVQLGVLAYRAHNLPEAQQFFTEAVRQDATHCVEGYTNLALLARERGPRTDEEWVEVIRNIRSALALDDRYLPARNQLALSYLQQAGDDPNSQRIFLAALVASQAIQVGVTHGDDLTPEVRGFLADLFNTWGVIDMRRGEIIKALEHFRRAYELNPNLFEAWVNYGTINLSFRGYTDARTAFEHALQLRANDYDSHVGLGVAFRGLAAALDREGRPLPPAEKTQLLQQSLQEYQRAVQIDAARPDVYYNLGVLYEGYMTPADAPPAQGIANLRTALGHLEQFVTRADPVPRFAETVRGARRHIRNIRATITALEAVSSGQTPPPQPPPGAPEGDEGTTPPAGGTTPPAGGAAPPAAPPTGATPPAAGAPAPAPAAGGAAPAAGAH